MEFKVGDIIKLKKTDRCINIFHIDSFEPENMLFVSNKHESFFVPKDIVEGIRYEEAKEYIEFSDICKNPKPDPNDPNVLVCASYMKDVTLLNEVRYNNVCLGKYIKENNLFIHDIQRILQENSSNYSLNLIV